MLEQGATAEEIKQNLAGIANGSLVVGESRLERDKTRENAPASGEGVVNGQKFYGRRRKRGTEGRKRGRECR